MMLQIYMVNISFFSFPSIKTSTYWVRHIFPKELTPVPAPGCFGVSCHSPEVPYAQQIMIYGFLQCLILFTALKLNAEQSLGVRA